MLPSLATWILVGALAGWIVSVLMGRDFRGGCLAHILLGMLGALLGGFVFRILGGAPVTGVNIYSVMVAVVGSLLLLWLLRLARK